MIPGKKILFTGMFSFTALAVFTACNDNDKTTTESTETKMNAQEVKKDTVTRKIDTTALPRPLKPGS
ncbi:MAG: hypothetical protein JWQ27_706 [Ferruginibacter sp.]|nr:hypothetical protein [Ferruginibacter sp.]